MSRAVGIELRVEQDRLSEKLDRTSLGTVGCQTYTERARKSLNPSCQGKLYFFSPPPPISFACFSSASSVRGGSPAFSIDLKTA